MTGLLHQLASLVEVVLELRPLQAVLDVIVDPIAAVSAKSGRLRLVDRRSIDGQADRLPHALVVKWALGILKIDELEPEATRQNGSQDQFGIVLYAFDQI